VNYTENPLETETIGHRARIETSLFEAGKQAGVSAPVIMTLAKRHLRLGHRLRARHPRGR
jgi:hypothetical protein